MISQPLVDVFSVARAKGIVCGLRPHLAAKRLSELEPHLWAFVEEQIQRCADLVTDQDLAEDRLVSLLREQWKLAAVAIESVKIAVFERVKTGGDIATVLATADPALANFEILADYRAKYRGANEGSQNVKGGTNV